jgi:glycosyltransferase involved in cell wall biosynthesis
MGVRQETFPILSQVPSALPSTGRDLTIAYFGQIRPNKGLEAFLELARLSIEQTRPFGFHIMGSTNRNNQGFAQALQAAAHPDVRWSSDLPFDKVAENLAQSFAAYLPFPDGASERRGSMPAAWLNGLPVLSTAGEATTDGIRERVLIVSTPKEALRALDELLARPAAWERLSRVSREYAKDHSWDFVAQRHAAMYLRLTQVEFAQ